MATASDVKQFVEALAFFTDKSASLSELLSEVREIVKNTEKPRFFTSAYDPPKTEAEKEEEWWEDRGAKTVARVMGGGMSTASIFAQMQDLEKKITDVHEAERLGIVSSQDAGAVILTLHGDYQKLTRAAAGYSVGGAVGGKAVQALQNAPKSAMGLVSDQLGGIGLGLMALMAASPLAGGLFGLMLWGQKNADRLRAEAGEVHNIFTAVGREGAGKAEGYFSSFQEKAQSMYGINRQEVQGILKEFLFAGLSVESIMGTTQKGLGEVGHNAVNLTLAMDKMFEIGSGFTARGAVQMVQKHGQTLDSSVKSMVRIEMAAKRAGAGVVAFTEETLESAEMLREYGVRADSVANTLLDLQDRFKNIGLNAQAAMTYASQGVKELAQGVKSFGAGMQTMLAEQMGLGGDQAARFQLLDALQQGTQVEMGQLVVHLFATAKKQTAGGFGGSEEVRIRSYLQAQGLGNLGAKAIYEIGEHVDKGNSVDSVSKEEWTEIRKSFLTEGQKTSDLGKQTYKLMQGLAHAGEGMLLAVTNLLAFTIMSVKALLAMPWKLTVVEGVVRVMFGETAGNVIKWIGELTGASTGVGHERDRLMAALTTQWKETAKAAKQAYAGISESAKAVKDIMGPLLKPITEALTFRVGDLDDSESAWDASKWSGMRSLSARFWARFEDVAKAQGLDPKELMKAVVTETGFNPTLISKAGAKGFFQLIHSVAKALKMPEDVWNRFDKMSPEEQLEWFARYLRMAGIKGGMDATDIKVAMLGKGFMKENPYNALYVGRQFWQTEKGREWLRDHPRYKLQQEGLQYKAYEQNKEDDFDSKGYISREDMRRVVESKDKSRKNVKVNVAATRNSTPQGPEITLMIRIEAPAVAFATQAMAPDDSFKRKVASILSSQTSVKSRPNE